MLGRVTAVPTDRLLLLLRHAKAEQVAGKPDHDRVLAPRGRRDAEQVGRWLYAQGVACDLVICSTAVRTRQTWEHAIRGGARSEFVEYRRAVYLGGAGQVLDTIREDAGEVGTLMVIGHAPAVPALVSMLTDGEGSVEAHRAVADGFPTSGLAVLRFSGSWASLDHGDALLERFHVCRG